MAGPLAYAIKNIAWNTTVVVPLLGALPSTEERRVRVLRYLGKSSQKLQFFQNRIREHEHAHAARIEALWNEPDAMWWRDRACILKTLPRPIALAPLIAQLKVSELLDRLEANRPRTAYWSYWTFDLAARVTLVLLSINMLRQAFDVAFAELPSSLAGRVTRWTASAALTTGLTVATINAVCLHKFDEVRAMGQEEPSLGQRRLKCISDALYTMVADLPEALGDTVLFVSLPRLHWLGRVVALGTIACHRYPLVKHLLCWSEDTSEPYDETDVVQPPRYWNKVEKARVNNDAHALQQLRDDDAVCQDLRVRASKYLDQYCFRELATHDEPTTTRINALKDRMSTGAKTVFVQFPADIYHQLPRLSLGEWLAEHETHPATEVLKTWTNANPAEKFAYQWKKGHRLAALNGTSDLLFSRSLAHDDLMPWGEPMGEFGGQQFSLAQARIRAADAAV